VRRDRVWRSLLAFAGTFSEESWHFVILSYGALL
jgi:hypothetical protein